MPWPNATPPIDELTADIINAFIDEIALHGRITDADGKRTQEIEIFCIYVGIVDTPSEEELEILRKEHYKETT